MRRRRLRFRTEVGRSGVVIADAEAEVYPQNLSNGW